MWLEQQSGPENSNFIVQFYAKQIVAPSSSSFLRFSRPTGESEGGVVWLFDVHSCAVGMLIVFVTYWGPKYRFYTQSEFRIYCHSHYWLFEG